MLRKIDTGQLYLHETFSLGVPDGGEKHTPLPNNESLHTFQLYTPEAFKNKIGVNLYEFHQFLQSRSS